MTLPLPFRWPYALLFWAVYVWVFVPEMRIVRAAKKAPLPAEDRGSIRVVSGGFLAATSAAFILAFVAGNATLPGSPLIWFFAGVIALICGSLLRRHCFRELGKFFTGAVSIQPDHRVIDTGAYRWVRHPSYSAALLMIVGIAIALGNWIGVVIAAITAVGIYSYRARVEEEALLAALGEPYARFMATRRRFIPYLW